jgi:hypothetical protein
MADWVIERLTACVELEEGPDGTEPAGFSADGDEAWLLDQRDRGNLLLARLTLTVTAARGDGGVEEVVAVDHGLWVERAMLPVVEAQVAELAPRDLPALRDQLCERGIAVELRELEDMFIHIELGERIRAELRRGARR